MKKLGPIVFTLYVLTILSANWLVEHFGLVSVGFGLMATAGTYAAGAALLLRDTVQDLCGRWWVIAGIATGALLTLLVSPALALASAAAFLVSELADMAVYTPLRDRGWARAVVASNIVGAVVDTFIFLWLAGFPVTRMGVSGQLVGKLIWATALPVAVVIAVREIRDRRHMALA